MAVRTGWVGTSGKAETGKAWVSEARLGLRLPKAGWMSEMVGKSTEVRVVNTANRTAANIHTLMGSPTAPGVYIFENTGTISAASRGGWALQTGAFPAGSTLTIINRGAIRGGGGDGGAYATPNGNAGGTALILNFPVVIDNTTGTIWGGGGGGGQEFYNGGDYEVYLGGGGGAGIPAGNGGKGRGGGGDSDKGRDGTATKGGIGMAQANDGGAPGAAGGSPSARNSGKGGRGGYSVQTNGNAATWIAVGDRRGSVV